MIEKDISQYLSLEQRARNLFGENYDLENCVEELRQYRRLTDRVKAIYGDQMTLKIMVDAMEMIARSLHFPEWQGKAQNVVKAKTDTTDLIQARTERDIYKNLYSELMERVMKGA